jgi:uncharacterized protein YpmB
MRKGNKILIAIAVILLVAISSLAIFIYITSLEPLRFRLKNCDNEGHNVTVEI